MEEVDGEDGRHTAMSQNNFPVFNVQSTEFTEKKEQLAKVFKQCDTNQDGFLSEMEIQKFMEKQAQKKGKIFKNDVVKVLVSQMDKNRDGKVDADEFLDFYVQGEIKLKQKYKETMRDLAAAMVKKDKLQKQLSEVEGKEILNSNGLMSNSKIKITILSAYDIQTNNVAHKSKVQGMVNRQTFSPYVIVQVGENSKFTSKGLYYNSSVVWNHQMEFPIFSGQEVLKFVLLCKDDFAQTI